MVSGWQRRLRLWSIALAVICVLGMQGSAVEESVTIHARWTVLPYQMLRIVGSEENPSDLAYRIPVPTAVDRAQGFIEQIDALRLEIVSNGAWKVVVWTEQTDLDGRPVGDVWVRGQWGEFFAIGRQPQLLARGESGTFEISVDYRVFLDASSDAPRGTLSLIYLIMSD